MERRLRTTAHAQSLFNRLYAFNAIISAESCAAVSSMDALGMESNGSSNPCSAH